MIDKFAEEFCFNNNKHNRNLLGEALFRVPRNRIDLLPYYSRLVATLKPGMHDVAETLVRRLSPRSGPTLAVPLRPVKVMWPFAFLTRRCKPCRSPPSRP